MSNQNHNRNLVNNSDHVTYANIRRRDPIPSNVNTSSSSSHLTAPTTKVTTRITLLTPEEEAADQPPPPPKTRPPALTPPPLPPNSNASIPDANNMQGTLNRSNKPSLQSSSQVQSQRQQSQQQQPSSSSNLIRTYVRSPGTYLSSSNFNNNNNNATPTPCDEESFLNSLSREDLVARIRIIQDKNRKLIKDNGQMMKDLNHHLNQLSGMKHHNFQLMSDNNELRDLCCYLDDERSRARSLAKEWQSFGTHMSRVMRHEVSSYAKKLQVLEDKQFELVRENFELKQLCIMLDNSLASRDSGVGEGSTGSNASSHSNDVGDAASLTVNTNPGVGIRDGRNPITAAHHPPNSSRLLLNPQTMDYIRSLEQRVKHLEWEKKQQVTVNNSNTNTIDSTYTATMRSNRSHLQYPTQVVSHQQYIPPPHRPLMSPSCLSPPPEVTEALKNLRVRESHSNQHQTQVFSPSSTASCPPASSSSQMRSKMNKTPDMDAEDMEVTSAFENQRAAVKTFVNNAWKKIEDGARIVSGRRSLSRERRSRKKSF